MKKLYYITFSIHVFLLLTTSCAIDLNQRYIAQITETNKTIEFEVDKDVCIWSSCYRYYTHENNEYIAFATSHYDKDYDEIICFDLLTKNEYERIPIYKDGPNSIGSPLKGFYFVSHDSIATANKYEPEYHFVNRKGEILYSYKLKTEKTTHANIHSLINCPHAIVKDTIIFPQRVPYTRPPLKSNPKDFKFSECPLAYIINTKANTEIASEVTFPELYTNDTNTNHNESYSREYDGKNFVYAFFAYDSLIVTRDHKTAKTYCAKSRYIGDVKNPGVPQGTSIPDIMRKLSTLASYGNLIYDPYREVYYRFCYFENDYPGPYTLEYTISGGAFTIMIIDKKFNVIGETVFPDKRYASKIFFVNKDGLWLSENHFLRKDMTDDKLVFRCLQLEYY